VDQEHYRVALPATLDEATAELAGLGALLRAKEWHRAALVAAFVRLDDKGGRPSRNRAVTRAVVSARAFAERRIVGLSNQETVRFYVQRWLDANDGAYPEPGTEVVLPDADWPPGSTRGSDGYDSPKGVADTVGRITGRDTGADELAEAIAARPEVAKRVVERAVLADPGVALHAERTAAERWVRTEAEREAEPYRPELVPPQPFTYSPAELALLQARRLIYRSLTCLREAAEALAPHASALPTEDTDYIELQLGKLSGTADLVRMAMASGQPIDWDAEAASWGEEPGQ
jgi:hypothetical protein